MRTLVHQSLHDLRLLRPLLQAWLAVLVLRFLPAALPLDLLLPGTGGAAQAHGPGSTPSALFYVHLAAMFAYLGLTIVLLVQLVQADSPVRSDAFWITRPVSRSSMFGSKLVTSAVLFVAAPVCADIAVLAVNGFTAATIVPAVAEGIVEQLAFVLPVMALAAATADVTGFALSGLALLVAGPVALIVALSSLDRTTRALSEPTMLPGVAVVIACGVLVTGIQFAVRSRRVGIGLVALSVLLFGLVVRLSPVHARAPVGAGVRRQAGEAFSAAPGSSAVVLGRRVSVVESSCADESCRVVLREVRPTSALTRRRPIQVDYALVDPQSRRPILPLAHSVDAVPYIPTGPHVAVAWKWLDFDARTARLDRDPLPHRSLVATVFEPGEVGRAR
jgi:hypothetical protein